MSRTWKDRREWKELKAELKRRELRPQKFYCKTCNAFWRSTDKGDCPICKSVHLVPQQVK